MAGVVWGSMIQTLLKGRCCHRRPQSQREPRSELNPSPGLNRTLVEVPEKQQELGQSSEGSLAWTLTLHFVRASPKHPSTVPFGVQDAKCQIRAPSSIRFLNF